MNTTAQTARVRYRVYFRKVGDPKRVFVWGTFKGVEARDEAMRACVRSGNVDGLWANKVEFRAADSAQTDFLDTLADGCRGTSSGNASVSPGPARNFSGKPRSGAPVRDLHKGH